MTGHEIPIETNRRDFLTHCAASTAAAGLGLAALTIPGCAPSGPDIARKIEIDDLGVSLRVIVGYDNYTDRGPIKSFQVVIRDKGDYIFEVLESGPFKTESKDAKEVPLAKWSLHAAEAGSTHAFEVTQGISCGFKHLLIIKAANGKLETTIINLEHVPREDGRALCPAFKMNR